MAKIEIHICDITTLKVDAIVNAANQFLEPGGGVDGAIHQAAGLALTRDCKLLGGCPTGQAKVTRAYSLPCRFVIHAVGPKWNGGHMQEDELLANCYQSAFAIAEELHLQSIALPAISAGIFGFPIERATRIALSETKRFSGRETTINQIIFACFTQEVADVYLALNL